MARILITNHGTHSADKWAVTTAEMIFPLDDTAMVGERLIAAQKFQTQLAEILSPHHQNNIDEQKSKVAEDPDQFDQPHEVDHHVDDAVTKMVEAAKESPWAEHFAKPEVQKAMTEVIENHMAGASHVERMWHAAHNRTEQGDRYLARHGQLS